MLILILTKVNSLLYFYLIFELVNILAYSFVGFQSYNARNYESSVIFFLIGFIGSLVFLIGLYLKYSVTIPMFDTYADSLIFLAMFLKIGSFPFSF